VANLIAVRQVVKAVHGLLPLNRPRGAGDLSPQPIVNGWTLKSTSQTPSATKNTVQTATKHAFKGLPQENRVP
jgi:hypothetical protein